MKPQRLLALLAVVLCFSVRPAAADALVTGTVGWVFSGDLEQDHLSYGASIGFMGEGILGFEIEGTHTPDFFGETPGNNNVTTLMGNVILGVLLSIASSAVFFFFRFIFTPRRSFLCNNIFCSVRIFNHKHL